MNIYTRIAILAGVIVLAAGVGIVAYNAGVNHGIAQSGKIVVAAPPAGAVPYGYHHGWHPWFPGFFFGPLFVFLFFLFVVRGLFWRGGWHHRYRCGMHERMWNDEQQQGATPER